MLVPRIDINKDGFVEEAELEIWVRHKMQKWTVDEDVDAIFRDLDMNNNDKVTWKEYMTRTFRFTEEGWYLLRKPSTFEDVRANCFCASLLRAQIHMPRHALSARAKY